MRSETRLQLVDNGAVEALLLPHEVLAAVREAFILHSQGGGRIFPMVREALSAGGIFGIKSGAVESQGLLGFKAAGFWPANRARGGESHQATIVLFDPATGRPVCVIDGNAITTARTGAAGGLGLQLLARQESETVCVFGTGVQARIQLQYALRLLPALRHVRYVTSRGEPDTAFERVFFASKCTLRHARNANEAVASSDIVITATPSRQPLFDAAAVRPGTHINCVGADTRGKRELPEGLLQRARLFVDDRQQARQIGESQWAPEVACDELGDLLTGKSQVRRAAGDITVFDLTGLALQDLTVARYIHKRDLSDSLGKSIAWPW